MINHPNRNKQEDKFARAKEQAQAQYESIKEMVEALQAAVRHDDLYTDEYRAEDAERTIHEDALSVEVRTGWYVPGARDADTKPAEYRILLCTGGPAVQITGDLSKYGEPETARLEMQDWFLPWSEYRPRDTGSEDVLLAYARCFYFGE